MSLAYIKEPPIMKWLQRLTFHGRYMAVIVIGAICFGMVTPGMALIGWPLIVTGLIAEYGVWSGRYRWEWSALPFMIMFLSLAAVFLFATTTTGFTVWLLIILIFTLIERVVYLTLLARELRALPPKTQEG